MSNRRHSTVRNGLPPKMVACNKFYNALEDHGVDVEQRGSTGGGGIALEYSIEEGTTDQEAADEISCIAGAFCGAQENGELGDLEATVYEGDTVATWEIKAEWVDNWHTGEWDDEAVIDAALETIEVDV